MESSRNVRIFALAAGLFLAACADTRPSAEKPVPEPVAPAASAASAQLARIAVLEDARSTGGRELGVLARTGDPLVRARAARALGRMPFPEVDGEVTRDLLACLLDSDANVRAEATFALGMRGDPVAGEPLLLVCAIEGRTVEPDPVVRARAVEAFSNFPRTDLRERTLAALADPDPRVRLEAAQGASRWLSKDEQLATIDRALIDHLAKETDRDVIVYTLFSLERRKSTTGISTVTKFASSDDSKTRLFAVRALTAALQPGPSTSASVLELTDAVMTLSNAVHDSDWRVAAEAEKAIAQKEPDKLRILAGLDHSSANVRRATWDALASAASSAQLDEVRRWDILDSQRKVAEAVAVEWSGSTFRASLVRRACASSDGAEPSFMVRGASSEFALGIWGRLLEYEDFENLRLEILNQVEMRTAPTAPLVLASVARGLAHVPDPTTVGLLEKLARTRDPIVAEAAIEALGQHKTKESHELLLGFLRSKDNGLRLSALTALAEQPEPGDVDDLAFVFDDSQGDGAMEIRFNALRNAGKIGGDAARELCVRGLSAREPFVRKVAREELAKGWPDFAIPAVELPASTPGKVPLAGVDFPDYVQNPLVEVVTSRGTMVFELFPAEAPVHVHSFLELARRGYYDGLTFHRVVPDFVIQGGDYRGDGNGGTTFRVDANVRELSAKGATVPADSLRHEIGPRKFVRGSLGMPRNDDMDSGGSQFFVTHRETPHLDGRYTIFGELRDGFEVLDAIEVGDVIVSVRQAEPPH